MKKITEYIKCNSLELFALVGVYVTLVVLLKDYFLNMTHTEVYSMFNSCALMEGGSFGLKDFVTGLNPCFDGGTDRARFYSWFFWIPDLKFRLWFFQYFAFHPSLSLSWIFSVFLTPFMVYRLVLVLTKDSRISLLGAGLFLLSLGSLSTITMLFHSAKPLSTFGVVVGLWITARIAERIFKGEAVSYRRYLMLGFSLLAFLFWDELFYVYFPLALVFFLEFFRAPKEGVKLLGVYVILFLIFCLCVGKIFPDLIARYYDQEFNFFATAFGQNELILKFRAHDFLYDLGSLMSTHINPRPIFSYSWGFQEILDSLLLLGFVVVACMPVFSKIRNRFYLRSLGGLLISVVFIYLILTQTGTGAHRLIYGSFYWGCTFSLLFAIWFCTFWSSWTFKIKRYLAILSMMYLAWCGIQNDRAASFGHLTTFIHDQTLAGEPIIQIPMQPELRGLTKEEVDEIWALRNDLPEVVRRLESYPVNAYWLYFEAYLQSYGREPGPKDFKFNY